MSGFSTAASPGTRPAAFVPRTVKTGRFSVIAFYVLAATAIFLPFLSPGPEVALARWVIFSTVSALWLAFNLQWWTRLVIRPWICVSQVLIVSWLLASSLWSEDPAYTAARAVSLALLFVLLLVLTARIVRERHERLVLNLITLHGLVLFTPGLILWGIGMSYVPWTMRAVVVNGRLCGILWNPNQVALCGIIMFPLAFALWWESKRRVWVLGIMALILTSIYLSQSRNGFLSLVAGIVVFFAARYKAKWVFPAGMALGLTFAFLYQVSDTFETGVARFIVRKEHATSDDVNLAEAGRTRFEVWEPIIEEIKKRPYLGSGYGTGGTELDRFYQCHLSGLEFRGDVQERRIHQITSQPYGGKQLLQQRMSALVADPVQASVRGNDVGHPDPARVGGDDRQDMGENLVTMNHVGAFGRIVHEFPKTVDRRRGVIEVPEYAAPAPGWSDDQVGTGERRLALDPLHVFIESVRDFSRSECRRKHGYRMSASNLTLHQPAERILRTPGARINATNDMEYLHA